MNDEPPTKDRGLRRPYPWLIGVVLFAIVVLCARFFDARTHLDQAVHWIAGLGATGHVLFVLLYVIATVCLLPGSVLTLSAGAVFGLLQGIILCSIGATLGATAAFLTGRYLARDRIARRLAAYPRFQAIDRAVAREGWKVVLLTRLSPVFPFVLLNYAYGLTGVSLRHYFWASWLGMLPGTVLYVYLGSALGEAAGVGARREAARTPAEWALYGVGLVATLLVTIQITRLARRSLSERINQA